MTGTTYPTLPLAKPAPAPAGPVSTVLPRPGDWKYFMPRRERSVLAISILLSIGLHAAMLLGFNRRVAVAKPVHNADDNIIQMAMPDIPDDEDEKPVESLDNEPEEVPVGINVPMLSDMPSIVPVDAFVQPLDLRPKVDTDLSKSGLTSIPVNIARGNGGLSKLGKIFEVGDLDREPRPIVQPPPTFPPELKKEYNSSIVVLEFIITSKGEVVNPTSISSDHIRFEDAAIRGVQKWKFRPGLKGGRAVNTRVRISINFRVSLDN